MGRLPVGKGPSRKLDRQLTLTRPQLRPYCPRMVHHHVARYRFVACLLLAICADRFAFAQEPVDLPRLLTPPPAKSPPPERPSESPDSTATSTATATSPIAVVRALSPAPGVLMLRNGNLLRGQISLLGDRYLVALDRENEVRIPARDVELHCDTLLQAYQWRRNQLPPGQLSARLDLAEWCLRLGLVKQAADEATVAMRLEPDHPRLATLEQRIAAVASQTVTAKPTESVTSLPATIDQLEQSARDLPFGAVERFTATIQPMLLNRCGTNNCHGPGTPNDFHLLRPAPGQTSTRRFTLRNLYSTLQTVDRDSPDESPLLSRSRQAHGPAKSAPFREGEQVQYELLAQWVRQITQPKSTNSPATIGRPDAQLLQTTRMAGAESSPAISADAANGSLGEAKNGEAKSSASSPLPATSRDPFDPEVFNRRYLPAPPPNQ
jgi:hypothetical protein